MAEKKSSEETEAKTGDSKKAAAPTKPAVAGEALAGHAEEPEVEEKVEAEEILPDDTEVIVDEVEDEKELKEKLRLKKIYEGGEVEEVAWKPKTHLGLLVHNGEIRTMHEVMMQSAPIKEVGIVNKLLPEMQEEVIDVGRVQRVTDSGRRMRFRVVTSVGNGDGYVGVGESKGKEAGPTIRKSIDRAKLNIREIKRGCGSWECGCGKPHTVPFKISGKAGSVEVTLMPAPRGVGIVSGEAAKVIIRLAGIQDVWVTTQGHTKTGINFARAVVNALENTNYVKLTDSDAERLKIVTGQAKVSRGQEVPK